MSVNYHPGLFPEDVQFKQVELLSNMLLCCSTSCILTVVSHFKHVENGGSSMSHTVST